MQIERSLQRSFWFSWLHEVSGVHGYMKFLVFMATCCQIRLPITITVM